MAESIDHLTGRLMRERASIIARLRTHGKVTDHGYDFVKNVADLTYELPSGERFEIQLRAMNEGS